MSGYGDTYARANAERKKNAPKAKTAREKRRGYPTFGPVPVSKRSKPKKKLESRRIIKGEIVREDSGRVRRAGSTRKAIENSAKRRAIEGRKGGTVAKRAGSTVAKRSGLKAAQRAGMRMGPYGWVLAGAAYTAEKGLENQEKQNKKGNYIGAERVTKDGYNNMRPKYTHRDQGRPRAKREYGYKQRPVTEERAGSRSRVSRERSGTYKGKYFGPDAFRGDEDIRRAYLQAGGKKKFKTAAARQAFANDYRRADSKAKDR